jgi:hypothetical protein
LRENEKLNIQLDKKVTSGLSDLDSQDDGDKNELDESFESK